MPRLRNWLTAFLLCASCATVSRAHDPFQTTLEVQTTPDGLEISAIMSPASAAALLNTSEIVTKSTFAAKREELASAAVKVCSLLDAAGEPLRPVRTITSLNTEGEVCFLFQYDSTTAPDRVRSVFLATLSSGYFVGLTDRRFTPARHGVLFRSRDSHSFSAASANEAKTPPAPLSKQTRPTPVPTP